MTTATAVGRRHEREREREPHTVPAGSHSSKGSRATTSMGKDTTRKKGKVVARLDGAEADRMQGTDMDMRSKHRLRRPPLVPALSLWLLPSPLVLLLLLRRMTAFMPPSKVF